MPYYKFYNKNTKGDYFKDIPISEYDEFCENHKYLEPRINGTPGIHSGRGLGGGLKISDGFNDVLEGIKKANSRGSRKSTINTK